VRGYSLLVLDLVLALRREIPGLGTRKLHLLLQEPLAANGIKIRARQTASALANARLDSASKAVGAENDELGA
jgi:hypothetical protein